MIEAYISTAGSAKAEGKKGAIHRVTLDTETGTRSEALQVAEAPNPMFLAIHPNRNTFYAVNHTAETAGERGGSLGTYQRAGEKLEHVGDLPVAGVCPCHVAVGADDRVLATANYGSENISIFPVGQDGSPGERSDLHQHTGMGPDPKRQEKSYPHGVTFTSDGRHLCVADLGTDEIRVYEVDAETARLTPATPPAIQLEPGAGPRHIVFTPDGRHAYVANELNSTVTHLLWEDGKFTAGSSLSTLPAEFSGSNTTAEIMVSPDGGTVYVSNRGHDSLAIFRRNPGTGELKPAGHASSGSAGPWSFDVTPCGRWMFVTNRGGNEVRVFRVDPATGGLTPHGTPISLPAPMCVVFAPAG